MSSPYSNRYACMQLASASRSFFFSCVFDACHAMHMPQVVNLQTELTYLQGHLSTMEPPTPPPLAAQNQMPMTTAAFCVSNLPWPSNDIPPTVDVSTLLEEPQTQQSNWVSQQQQHYVMVGEGSGAGVSGSGAGARGGGDLQLLDRHGTAPVWSQPEPPPCTQ
jgi:LOB domain-containing protein 18